MGISLAAARLTVVQDRSARQKFQGRKDILNTGEKDMLLVIEIFLTVAAWRKGWRGVALIPVACGLVVGGMLGVSAGESGLSSMAPVMMVGDVIITGVLIAMAAKAPRKAAQPTAQPAPTAL